MSLFQFLLWKKHNYTMSYSKRASPKNYPFLDPLFPSLLLFVTIFIKPLPLPCHRPKSDKVFKIPDL